MNIQNAGKLRAIKDSELELMRAWRNAPSVRMNMYTRHEISADEHRNWWLSIQSREEQQYFMYELSGTPTGIVAFTSIDRANQNSSWAFYASPEAPKGTGVRMEFLALEYAFLQMGLHKLHCEVLAFNMPVIKLHQRFGFKVEGIFREHHKVDDVFVDVFRLGLLALEWDESRQNMKEKISVISRG